MRGYQSRPLGGIRPSFIFIFIFIIFAASLALGQKLAGVNPSYDLVTLRPPGFEPNVGGMDFLPDGNLVVCTWGGWKTPEENMVTPSLKGEMYIVSGVQAAKDASGITVTKIATGLQEPLGLKVVDGDIYISEREHLVRYFKTGTTWQRDPKFAATAPGGRTRSEWFYGLKYRDGFFYASFALAFRAGGRILEPQPHQNRGTVAKISKADGSIEYLAGGFRTQNGMTMNTAGEIFVGDNQGEWMPANKFVHIVKGRNYGVPPVTAPFDKVPWTWPTLWLPHGQIGASPSDGIYVESGVFKGQYLVADVYYGGLQRFFLEKVNGDYQGVAFQHTQGLEAGPNRVLWGPDGSIYLGGADWVDRAPTYRRYGLQKLVPNGKTNFEMLAIRSLPKGFEVEFTEELAPDAAQPSKFIISHQTMVPEQSYGKGAGPLQTLAVAKAELGADKRRVTLEVNGLAEKRVVYFKLNNVRSASGRALYSSLAWYTLRAINVNPVSVREEPALVKGGPWTARAAGLGALRVTSHLPGAQKVTVRDFTGKLLAEAVLEGRGEKVLAVTGSGPVLVTLSQGADRFARMVSMP